MVADIRVADGVIPPRNEDPCAVSFAKLTGLVKFKLHNFESAELLATVFVCVGIQQRKPDTFVFRLANGLK